MAKYRGSASSKKSRKAQAAAASREVELKLALAPDEAERLQKAGAIARLSGLKPDGRAATKILKATYYDTPARDFRKAGIGLRIRLEDGQPVQTVKVEDGALALAADRLESDTPLPPGTDTPDLGLVSPPDLRRRLQRLAGKGGLEAVFETDIVRTVRTYSDNKGVGIEAAYDQGEIRAGSAAEAVGELELELKGGSPASLYALACGLAASYPVRPAMESKAARGYRLAGGAAPRPVKAGPIVLADEATPLTAYSAILHDCIAHMTANEAAITQCRDPEGVHQMRVAMRRFRSAVATFRALLPGGGCQALADRAKGFFRILGEARDFDVFCTETLPAVPHEGMESVAALAAAAQELREEAWERAIAAIAAPDFARFVLEAAHYAASLDERAPKKQPALAKYAAARLDRRYEACARRARKLGKLDIAQRHDLRKRLKALRYEMEFFASLFDAPAQARFLKHLRRLQDVFGAMNDAAVAAGVARAAADRIGSREAAAAAGYVSGWLAADGERQFARAAPRWAQLQTIQPFWRS